MDSEQLRNVYAFAENWITDNQNSTYGSKHLLLGLVGAPSQARQFLENVGVDSHNFRLTSDRRGYGTLPPCDSEVKMLKARAATIANITDSENVTPEHLLLAILLTNSCYAYESLTGRRVDVLRLTYAICANIPNGNKVLKGLNGEKVAEPAVTTAAKTLVVNDSEDGINYCIDMTAKAARGEYDPMIGRKEELTRIVQTLLRRTKNNPLLIGEAGVGKSAVAEGLAQAMASGEIAPLRGKRLLSLDVASMIAGTHYRGDFEQRLKDTADAVQAKGNVVLFIDEIHNLVGAGATGESSMDAAEILKPMLARGELQTVGATTMDEYRRYIQKDPALDRRFQPIVINQPTEEECLQILRGVREKYQQYHKVTILDDAIEGAVKLSARYITDRNLPDKAFDVLDEACSAASIRGQKSISFDDAARVVSLWTGIPTGKLTSLEADKLVNLDKLLSARVVGQRRAVEAVSRAIKRRRAGISSPNRPTGSFIFAGPTGVGKTELAKALAECMFGKADELVRLDMSEYMDKTAVSKLIGTSAGYEGYDEGGVLCEKVRRKPYSVVLFDEVEKAHPDIFNLLLQILDEGRLSDNRGKVVDFRNTVIILTSNVGADIVSAGEDYEKMQSAEMNELKKFFRPELLNRLDDVIVFERLTKDEVESIARLLCKELSKRVERINLTFTDEAVATLAEKGYDPEYGARPLKRAIQRSVEDVLSEKILSGEIKDGSKVVVDSVGGALIFK